MFDKDGKYVVKTLEEVSDYPLLPSLVKRTRTGREVRI